MKLEQLLVYKDKLLNKKEELKNFNGNFSDYNVLLRDINNKLEEVNRLIFFNKEPDNSNGIIDLRSVKYGKYNLYLTGTDIYVGFIEYKGYHVSRRTGDVGCKIDSKYRGKGFAYMANVLLGDLLYKRDIKDFWGTAFSDNIGSIKLMEKYGGKRIAVDEYPNVVLYECETKPISFSSDNNMVNGRNR